MTKNNNDDQNVVQQTSSSLVSNPITLNPFTLSMRVYFSTYHLWAAKHFAELAKKIEDGHDGIDVFNIQHRAYVTSAIISSVAFMEAAINGLFQDMYDEYSTRTTSLNVESRKFLSIFWEATELNQKYVSILDKYQVAAKTTDKAAFDSGNKYFQRAELVIKLRDRLVHYKPADLNNNNEPKWYKQYSNQNIAENPLMSSSTNPWFPDKLLGYGCAKWAVDSSEAFVEEFFNRIGVTPNFREVKFDT